MTIYSLLKIRQGYIDFVVTDVKWCITNNIFFLLYMNNRCNEFGLVINNLYCIHSLRTKKYSYKIAVFFTESSKDYYNLNSVSVNSNSSLYI